MIRIEKNSDAIYLGNSGSSQKTSQNASIWTQKQQTSKKTTQKQKSSAPATRKECEIHAQKLFNAFNSKNKKEVVELLKGLNKSNIRMVSALYQQISKKNGEIAAVKSETGWFIGYNAKKLAPRRAETLMQGLLNCEALSLKEKRTYITSIVNNFSACAKDYMLSNIKKDDGTKMTQKDIDNFKKEASQHVIKSTNSSKTYRQDAYFLERDVAKLFGYFKP